MSSSSPLPPATPSGGYEPFNLLRGGDTATVEFRGRRVRKTEGVETKLNPLQRIRYGVQGALATVAAIPAAILTVPYSKRSAKNLLKKTAVDWVGGRAIGGTHTSAPTYEYERSVEKAYYQGKAFDPTNREEIKTYLKKPEIKGRLRDANGHSYLIVPHMSGFIFCPDGNLREPSFIKIWKTETGETITSANTLHKNCRAYLVAYNPLQEELGRKEADPEFDSPGINVFTFHWTQRMITGHNMNSFPMNKEISWRNGVHFKITDDEWKEMERFWNNEKTDQKQPLEGEKTFPDSKKRKHRSSSTRSEEEEPSIARMTRRRRSPPPGRAIMGGSEFEMSSSESDSESDF